MSHVKLPTNPLPKLLRTKIAYFKIKRIKIVFTETLHLSKLLQPIYAIKFFIS